MSWNSGRKKRCRLNNDKPQEWGFQPPGEMAPTCGHDPRSFRAM
jgi:hypothetical protein